MLPDKETLIKTATTVQDIIFQLQNANNLLAFVERIDHEIPAHAQLTWQTFCTMIEDTRKRLAKLPYNTNEPSK